MTTLPTNLKPLIDADILRYEIGFASMVGWRAITEDPEAIPPFRYVQHMLEERLDYICGQLETKEAPVLYLTEGRTFRFDLATTKPYKGTRKSEKPWHFKNLTAHMVGVMGAKVITEIEADDALAIDHLKDDNTIICSRDKDLRQVPGWFYSWELGKQAAFGPIEIRKEGTLELSKDHKKLVGTGLPFFCSQVLTGDTVDNIPGLPGCGPVAAYEALWEYPMVDNPLDILVDLFEDHDLLLEQGRLCWITRKLHEDGSPVLWEIGMED